MKNWILLILLLLAGAGLYLYIRKTLAVRRVRTMSVSEKLDRLHQISAPLGFDYNFSQDIFTSRLDAWQRDYGYCRIYDLGALHLNMVLDCEPIYFDYDGRTWLIEFWKGQYGITTGAEIGIYKADSLIPAKRRESTHFHQISEEEMPVFSFTLLRGFSPICRLCKKHWWLTAFHVGRYTEPEHLTMKLTITFPDREMCYAFLDGVRDAGYAPSDYYVSGAAVALTFSTPHSEQTRNRHPVLVPWTCFKNQVLLSCFHRFTEPFIFTLDRLLLLYEYLPVLFRHTLRIRRTYKRRRNP